LLFLWGDMMKVKLGDVCEIVSGTTPKSNCPEYWNGELNWITPAELNDDIVVVNESQRKITTKAVIDSNLRSFPAGTVLLSSRAPIGKVAIAGKEMYCNQGFKNLICSDFVYNKYLFYFLKSKVTYLNSLGRGATFKEISKTIVENIQINLPKKEEQYKIVHILDKINEIIFLRQQQLKKLDELVKSRFIEMFGSFPENSKNWKICTIKEIVSDVRYGTSRAAVDGGKYPYLRMNNITYDGELDLTDLKYIDIPDKELEKCTVKCGDVLFNRTNSKELVGKTCVYNRNDTMVLAGFIIRIRVNENILPVFLAMFLNMDFSKTMLKEMCKSAIGQANINATELQKIRIILPPIELQEEFVKFKNQTGKSKLEIKKSLDKLEILKKSLMQEYFS